MKKQERQHLKENEFVSGVATVTNWFDELRRRAPVKK